MKKMKNRTKDKIVLIIFCVVVIYMFFICCYGIAKLFAADKVLFTDKITGTKYIEHKNYIEVKGTDGYAEYIGNNTELEY